MIKTAIKTLILYILLAGISLSSPAGTDIRDQLAQEFQLPQDSVFPAQFIRENTLTKEYYSFLKGTIYKNDEDYTKAIDSFWEGISADTSEPRFYQEISEIKYLQSDYTTALAFVRLALQQDPDNARSHLLLGTIYARQNKHALAIEELERSVSLDSEQPNIESILGDEYLKSAQFNEAIVHLEKSTLTNVNDIVSYFQLGNLYLFKMDYVKSADNFKKVLRLNPNITMAQINLGTALESLGRTYEAESAYRIALQQEPDNHQARERLGSIYLDHREYAKATTELTQVISKDSSNLIAQLKYGQALFYLNELTPSRQVFERVLQHQKNNDMAKLYRGFILHLTHQPEEALLMFTSALVESTQQDDTYTVYYDYFLNAGRQKEGIYYLEKIRSQYPQEWINDYYIGISYSSLSSTGSAIKYLQSGIAKNPKEFNLWFHLGVAYHLARQINDAADAFKKAIDLNPRDPEAYNYCGFMLANEGMRLKEAQSLVEKAYELAPGKSYILDSLGWVYYQQGKFKEALEKAQEALVLSPDDPEVLIHLGDIQNAMGNKTAALESWEKAYKYMPGNSSLSEKIKKLGK